MRMYSNALFVLRDQWMIEILSEAMSTALVGYKFSRTPLKISFCMRKKAIVTANNSSDDDLQDIKTFLTFKLSKNCKSGNTLSSREPASSYCLQVGNALCSCLPVWPAQLGPKLCRSAALETLLLIPQSNLPLFSRIAFRIDCHMTSRGLSLDSNLNSAAWQTSCKDFSALKSLIKTVWSHWSLNSSLAHWKMLKLRTAVSRIQPSFPRLWLFSSSKPVSTSNKVLVVALTTRYLVWHLETWNLLKGMRCIPRYST